MTKIFWKSKSENHFVPSLVGPCREVSSSCLPERATVEEGRFQEVRLAVELVQPADTTAREVETTGAASSPFRFH